MSSHKIKYLPVVDSIQTKRSPTSIPRVEYDPETFTDIINDFVDGKCTLQDSVKSRGIPYSAFYSWRLASPELWAAVELAKQIVAERTESEIISMVDNAKPESLLDLALLDRQVNARYRALQYWHPEKYRKNGSGAPAYASIAEAIQAARERILQLK